MRKKILYGTRKMNEYYLNCCHSHMCETRQRRRCIKIKECLHPLLGVEKREIVGTLNWPYPTQKEIDRYNKKLKRYRQKEFKLCKPVEFIVKRP